MQLLWRRGLTAPTVRSDRPHQKNWILVCQGVLSSSRHLFISFWSFYISSSQWR
jgi:hypothetical protein